jgi:hypothetical protein
LQMRIDDGAEAYESVVPDLEPAVKVVTMTNLGEPAAAESPGVIASGKDMTDLLQPDPPIHIPSAPVVPMVF